MRLFRGTFIEFNVANKMYRKIARVVKDSEKHWVSYSNCGRIIRWVKEHLEAQCCNYSKEERKVYR
jgi:hypothetical protein